MNQYKIIIVEDDKELLDNVQTFMIMNGFAVTGVSSAAEFYSAVADEIFDLAVIDIGLPDASDFQLARYLRENTETRIIVLTAKGTIEDKLQGYSAGADAYFVKPVDSWELKGCINSILGRYRKSIRERGGGETAESDLWIFDSRYLKIVTPEAKEVSLTTKEGVFIELLLAAEGRNVERGDIFSELNKIEGLNYDNSALDILVARLRKRVKAKTGSELPLRTVRSVGYCFYAPARIEN